MTNLEIKISLSDYNEPHYIYLGNNKRISSFSRTRLEKHLRYLKKILSDNLRNLNQMYSNLITLYRSYYFDLNSNIISLFNEIDNSFKTTFDYVLNCPHRNENSYIFNRINQCYSALKKIIKVLDNFSKKNKHYSLKNALKPIEFFFNSSFEIFDNHTKSLNLNDYQNDFKSKPYY